MRGGLPGPPLFLSFFRNDPEFSPQKKEGLSTFLLPLTLGEFRVNSVLRSRKGGPQSQRKNLRSGHRLSFGASKSSWFFASSSKAMAQFGADCRFENELIFLAKGADPVTDLMPGLIFGSAAAGSLSFSNSSRSTSTSSGASMPSRTRSFVKRTTVTTIESPTRILSLSLRDKTNILTSLWISESKTQIIVN